METKRTKSRLDKTLPKVEAWAKDMWPPNEWLDEYLAGGGEAGLASSDIYKYGMQMCSQGLLDAKDGNITYAIQHMAFGFVRRAISYAIRIQRLNGTTRDAVEDLDGLTNLIFGTIALGRPDVAKSLYLTILAGIEGGYGVRDGHDLPIGSTLRYAAFGLSIISRWLDKPLDLDKHALPRDPAWGPLVSQWREPDINKFLPALLSACDVHIDRIAVTYREHETIAEQFKFSTPLLAVHPTEILAVLRLRDLLGLPNPTRIDHPLMQTPYAQITCTPEFLASQGQRDELLDKFLNTFRQRDPQVLPAGL
ncbi:TPA: hypothetical protein ACKP7A_003085 [Serratia liquefaciens]|uniref:hypothetical protein n=1 Tax=Serratia liquefaciens TaxID=614 RepID=UPI0021C737A8|nr:hypothetical protein [Serratia liquefaciens]